MLRTVHSLQTTCARAFGVVVHTAVVLSALSVGAAQAEPFSEPSSSEAQTLAAPTVGLGSTLGLEPFRASAAWHDGLTIGLGAAYEQLTNRTGDRFSVPVLSLCLDMSQHIRDWWSGGVSLNLSQWDLKRDKSGFASRLPQGFASTAPLRIFSFVEFGPRAWPGLHRDSTPKMFRYLQPSAFAGLGYLTFLQKRGWPLARGEELNGEAAARWGVGFRVILPRTVAVSLKVEKWRGVKTFSYTGETATLTAEWGDL